MVMRIDDRAGRIDDFFGSQSEPIFARIGVEPALRCGGIAGGHDVHSQFLVVVQTA